MLLLPRSLTGTCTEAECSPPRMLFVMRRSLVKFSGYLASVGSMWQGDDNTDVTVIPSTQDRLQGIDHNTSEMCERTKDRETTSAQSNSVVVYICTMLGVSKDALTGWAKLHVQPHHICLAYYAAIAIFSVSGLVLYGFGFPWLTAVMQIPAFISVTSVLCMAAMIWHHGPAAASKPVFMGISAFFVVPTAFFLIASFIGPDSMVPYRSRLGNVAGCICFMFTGFCAGALGGTAADHPPQPYSSLLPPLKNAAFSTLRFIDTMTDFGVVRILLQQVSTLHPLLT